MFIVFKRYLLKYNQIYLNECIYYYIMEPIKLVYDKYENDVGFIMSAKNILLKNNKERSGMKF